MSRSPYPREGVDDVVPVNLGGSSRPPPSCIQVICWLVTASIGAPVSTIRKLMDHFYPIIIHFLPLIKKYLFFHFFLIFLISFTLPFPPVSFSRERHCCLSSYGFLSFLRADPLMRNGSSHFQYDFSIHRTIIFKV